MQMVEGAVPARPYVISGLVRNEYGMWAEACRLSGPRGRGLQYPPQESSQDSHSSPEGAVPVTDDILRDAREPSYFLGRLSKCRHDFGRKPRHLGYYILTFGVSEETDYLACSRLLIGP